MNKGGNSFHWVNVTNVLVEGLRIAHFDGSLWIHFSQNITVRNVTLFNRNLPEETGNIEVGGMGSHGAPPPRCAWSDGKFNPDDPCLAPGGNWQYELNLLRPTSNFTMRDSTVNGGDDNVCIKNDTDGVLVENVHFTDGHGASIGSIPDCNGCHGFVSNIDGFIDISKAGWILGTGGTVWHCRGCYQQHCDSEHYVSQVERYSASSWQH